MFRGISKNPLTLKAISDWRKALKLKANEMQSSIQNNIDEISKLALETGAETDITQLLPEKLKLESGEIKNPDFDDVNQRKIDLANRKAVLEEEIKAFELKASQFPKQKGWKVQANNRRRELENIDEDMLKIGNFLEEYQLELMEAKSDSAETLKTAKKDIQKLNLKKSDESDGQSVTVMGGSPTIQSQKVNNMISSSGIYPVDPSLLVALASTQKG